MCYLIMVHDTMLYNIRNVVWSDGEKDLMQYKVSLLFKKSDIFFLATNINSGVFQLLVVWPAFFTS